MSIPKALANFITTLAAGLSSTGTTLTINTSVDDDGTTLSGTYYLTLGEGTSTEEHMIVTLAGSAGTIVTRGISRVDGTTEKSANKNTHTRGTSVKMTDIALLRVLNRLNGDEAFDSPAWTGVASIAGLATPTAGETTKAANVDYVNNVAIAGASDATETGKGIVELATSAEAQAGTDIGSTGAYLSVRPSYIASNIQNTKFNYAADAGSTDAYAITLVPAISAYATGQIFTFKANTVNTGAATLNVNAKGAKTIKKNYNQDLENGDIAAGMFVTVIYDGTNFQMVNQQATMPTTALLSEMATFFGLTDITGTEAETLTSNGNANSVHYHLKKIGVDSFNPLNSAATKVITHNLGSIPSLIKIKYGTNLSLSSSNQSRGEGMFDGTNYALLYFIKDGSPAYNFYTSSSYIIVVDNQNSATLGWDAVIISVTSTEFTIDVVNWATAEPIFFTWEVER